MEIDHGGTANSADKNARHISMELTGEGARVTSLSLRGSRLVLTIEAELADSQVNTGLDGLPITAEPPRRRKNTEIITPSIPPIAPGAEFEEPLDRPGTETVSVEDHQAPGTPMLMPSLQPSLTDETDYVMHSPSGMHGTPPPVEDNDVMRGLSLGGSPAGSDGMQLARPEPAPAPKAPEAPRPSESGRFSKEAKSISLDLDVHDAQVPQPPTFAPPSSSESNRLARPEPVAPIQLNSLPDMGLSLQPSVPESTGLSLGFAPVMEPETEAAEPARPQKSEPPAFGDISGLGFGPVQELQVGAMFEAETAPPASAPQQSLIVEPEPATLSLSLDPAPLAPPPAAPPPSMSMPPPAPVQAPQPSGWGAPTPPAPPVEPPREAAESWNAPSGPGLTIAPPPEPPAAPIAPAAPAPQPPPVQQPPIPSAWDAGKPAFAEESSAVGGERHGEPLPSMSFGVAPEAQPAPSPAPVAAPTMPEPPAPPSDPVAPQPAPGADKKASEAGGTTVLIRYTCPKCKTQGMQPVDKVGTVVNCSNCGKAMRLVMKK